MPPGSLKFVFCENAFDREKNIDIQRTLAFIGFPKIQMNGIVGRVNSTNQFSTFFVVKAICLTGEKWRELPLDMESVGCCR
jgi:hypothetical protein